MEFLTIDFETASIYTYSPCSVAIYEFKDNNYKKILSTLINPGDVTFMKKCIDIHGITPEMVKDAPPLKKVLKDICNIISNKFVFAHNAGFDISKIVDGCDIYNIPLPEFEYADTLMLAKRTWNGLINYKLNTVSEFLDIDLDHHKADSDAVACGNIVLKAAAKHETDDLNILLEKIKYQKGYIHNNEFVHAYSKTLSTKTYSSGKSKSDYDKLKNVVINENSNSMLNGKHIVFTGALAIKREEAMQLAANCGAIPQGSVNKKTNYLVVGNDDYGNFKLGNKSNKMIKAEELISKGQDLELITEDDFLEYINS